MLFKLGIILEGYALIAAIAEIPLSRGQKNAAGEAAFEEDKKTLIS